MYHYTMKSTTMNSESEPAARARIELGPDGCLFDHRTRSFLGEMPDSNPGEALGALRMAARQLHLMQERWAETKGLSEGRLQALFILFKRRDEGLSLGHLAEIMGVSPRAVTSVIDLLEKDGLVERVPDLNDRRSVKARLTQAGKERIEAIARPALGLTHPLFKGFTTEEIVQLRHLNLKLLANAYEVGRFEDDSRSR